MKWAWLLVCAAALSAADRPPLHLPANAIPVSGESPFAAGCDGRQTGQNFLHSAVEPWLAVNPNDALHLIGLWQQDRWANGAARGLLAAVSLDGGRTWRQSVAPFTACSGGAKRFLRASDPWVSISPSGVAFAISLSLSTSSAAQAILVSSSADGGAHWGPAVTILEDQSDDVFDDKESITADPLNSSYVYAVWDRLQGLNSPRQSDFRGPVWFARTSDGGATWEPARAIYDPGPNAQTIGNQIVVLPDGTLIDLCTGIQNATAPLVRDEGTSLVILRSLDKGVTWSAPITVAETRPVGVSDVKTGVPVRTSGVIATIAADPSTAALYVAWQDGRFSNGAREGIAFSRSLDGGLTWSAPEQINQVTDVQAFTPAMAVSRDGRLAVTYYDFRKDTDDPKVLLTSYWRLMSADGGRTWSEAAMAEPFDLSSAPLVEGGLFLGDYQGLAAAGDGFVSLFALSGSSGIPSQVFAASRPFGTDRLHNGHVEVNRYLLRREIEEGKKRK